MITTRRFFEVSTSRNRYPVVFYLIGLLTACASLAGEAPGTNRYYAHMGVEDRQGVIAPWYQGQNGPFDFRIGIAAQILRRYPWLSSPRCEIALPEYLLSSYWNISTAGVITTRPLDNWMNGDRGQLAAYVLYLLPEYYRYSGDPMAIAHATMEADAFLQFALTDEHHAWPRFPITVPTKGKPYGKCDSKGFIQLDLAGRAGYGLLHTYELTGDARYFEAVKHWGDVFAEKRKRVAGQSPWNRYANFEEMDWEGKDNKMTGGVVWILYMLDELIRLGYTGKDNSIVAARDAGREYLRDTLLPAWWVNDTWGRQYWDWPCPVQVPNITASTVRYMLDHKDYFPNWRNDCRNILALCLNRTCVSPDSQGGVYAGAWAYPESCACCGLCLEAGPQLLAEAWARYGLEADSEWAREIARRQMVLAMYDCEPSGVAEDNIRGGLITNGDWFEAAHLSPLESVLGVMRWLPEFLAPSRENHVVRSSAVINSIRYGKGMIAYSTYDAPSGTKEVMRLAFVPKSVKADGRALSRKTQLDQNGFTVQALPSGDCMVTIRHDGARSLVITGRDPQHQTDDAKLAYTGPWAKQKDSEAINGGYHMSAAAGAACELRFDGNQVRMIGEVSPQGGLADVYLDGTRQLSGIDCFGIHPLHQQVLFSRSGLPDQAHEIKIMARGEGNPRAEGRNIYVDAIQSSATKAKFDFGEGGGPTGFQRLVFGRTAREDYRDQAGNQWRPGAEFVVRSGSATDSVAKSWWTEPATMPAANTSDPELYRYGVHASEFTVYLTVGPGKYQARLKFAASTGRQLPTKPARMDVSINGRQMISDLDVVARAGGMDKALDLQFRDLNPVHGIIELRFTGCMEQVEGKPVRGEAFVQAIELGSQPK